MKLFKDGEEILICQNKDGNYYLITKVKANRNINSKGNERKKVDEVIIIGMHKSKFEDFIKRNGYQLVDA